MNNSHYIIIMIIIIIIAIVIFYKIGDGFPPWVKTLEVLGFLRILKLKLNLTVKPFSGWSLTFGFLCEYQSAK